MALAIHERQLAEHGGLDGIRDAGMLESALAKPQQLFAYGQPTPDLADLAASLAYGLARNHPFVDGNKRTAHVCYRVFIELKGGKLQATLEDKYAAMAALAAGDLDQPSFAQWLRERISIANSQSVQER